VNYLILICIQRGLIKSVYRYSNNVVIILVKCFVNLDFSQKFFMNSINTQFHKNPSSLTRGRLKVNDNQHDEDKRGFWHFWNLVNKILTHTHTHTHTHKHKHTNTNTHNFHQHRRYRHINLINIIWICVSNTSAEAVCHRAYVYCLQVCYLINYIIHYISWQMTQFLLLYIIFHIITQSALFSEKFIKLKKCIVIFWMNLWVDFLILRSIQRDIIKSVYQYFGNLLNILLTFLWILNFLKNIYNILTDNFVKIHTLGHVMDRKELQTVWRQ